MTDAQLTVCLFFASVADFAQPVRPQFEAASIKPSGESARPRMNITPGRLNFTKTSLRRAIYVAYHLARFEISGGPGWIDSYDFDIVALLDPKDVALERSPSIC